MSGYEFLSILVVVVGILVGLAIIGDAVHGILTNRTFLAYFHHFWRGDE